MINFLVPEMKSVLASLLDGLLGVMLRNMVPLRGVIGCGATRAGAHETCRFWMTRRHSCSGYTTDESWRAHRAASGSCNPKLGDRKDCWRMAMRRKQKSLQRMG